MGREGKVVAISGDFEDVGHFAVVAVTNLHVIGFTGTSDDVFNLAGNLAGI